MEIRTLTIKTSDGKNEYVCQIGNNVYDRVGRVNGFKSIKTSDNFSSLDKVEKWIKNNIS